MPRAAIERVIRDLAPGYQFEQEAMAQLRAAAEAHIVSALEAARFVADAERVPTLDVRHMHVVAAVTNKMTTPTPLPWDVENALASSTNRKEAPVPVPQQPAAAAEAESAAAEP